jgi:hypothetical protein
VIQAAEYLETRTAHWSKLHRFWNKNQVLTKQRFLHRATQQAYSTKVSRFVSWKITQEEFLNEGQSIVVKHSRQTSRNTEWRRTRRARFQRPPPGMEPIIAFGWGQSNSWQKGHTSASQTVSSASERDTFINSSRLTLLLIDSSTTDGYRWRDSLTGQ